MIRLAFKKRKIDGRPIDSLIAWFGRSNVCHVELVFSDGVSFSSTMSDGGFDGVRCTVIDYAADPQRWILVDLPEITESQERLVRRRAERICGAAYDKRGVKSFVLRWVKQAVDAWFCSEAVVYALQAIWYFGGRLEALNEAKPDKVQPADLLRIVRRVE
jgi:hypothetical protein